MVGTRRRAADAAQSGLLLAVIEDDLAAVQRELAQPSPQWVSSEGGLTALHLAAGFAGPAVLAALLEAPSLPPGLVNAQLQADYRSPDVLHPLLGAAVDETRLAFHEGATALHIAVYFGDADAVRLLLAVGASPNVPDADGRTACHYATCSWVHCSATSGHHRAAPHPDIPGLLLEAGGNILSPTANSRGSWVAPPLAEVSEFEDGKSASRAFLRHAAEQHEAGKWAPPPTLDMASLVWCAINVGSQPFFFNFWQHGNYDSEETKLYNLVRMGHVEAVAAMLSQGSPAPATQQPWPRMLWYAVRLQQPAMVQLMLQHGVPVTCAALTAAVVDSALPQPGMLRMLLAAGQLPEPEPISYTCMDLTCPILRLLQSAGYRALGFRPYGPYGNAQWRPAAAECMELMAEAGMKPCVYTNVMCAHTGRLLKEYDPLEHNAYLTSSSNSWLWRAYQRPAWTPASHQDFQTAFRAAVRTLLLAAHRCGKQPGHSMAAGLGSLPQDVLLQVVGVAAYPTCAWV